MLTDEEKRELLMIARSAITDALQGRPARAPVSPAPALQQPGGAFVTIRIGRELRGCIGYIESAEPLCHVVAEVAVKAALEDPRFTRLRPPELELATLEVSVLSPLHLISGIEEIEVGTHGILLQLDYARGLLLPQVATEYRWSREEFLDNTARKAGLPRNAWKDPDARIYIFSAEVFREEEAVV